MLPALLLWQVSRGGRRGPLPLPSRLAITEPKWSLARSIVVPMSFQHKINCLAHQLARGHRQLLPERTYSDVKTSQPAEASTGSDPSGPGSTILLCKDPVMPESAQLWPGTSDSSATLVSYLSSPSREQDKQFRERQVTCHPCGVCYSRCGSVCMCVCVSACADL